MARIPSRHIGGCIASAHNEKVMSDFCWSYLPPSNPTTAAIATPPLVSTGTKHSYRAMNHGQVSELNESNQPKGLKIFENAIWVNIVAPQIDTDVASYMNVWCASTKFRQISFFQHNHSTPVRHLVYLCFLHATHKKCCWFRKPNFRKGGLMSASRTSLEATLRQQSQANLWRSLHPGFLPSLVLSLKTPKWTPPKIPTCHHQPTRKPTHIHWESSCIGIPSSPKLRLEACLLV